MSCVCVCVNGEIEVFIKNIFFQMKNLYAPQRAKSKVILVQQLIKTRWRLCDSIACL